MAFGETAEFKAVFTLVRESGCTMGFSRIDTAMLFLVDIRRDVRLSCIWLYDAALSAPPQR